MCDDEPDLQVANYT